MPLKLVLALLLVIVFTNPTRCDETDWSAVVSYQITVRNTGPGARLDPAGDVIVGISAPDVHRRAVVPVFTFVTATSFAGGSLLISASPAAAVLAQMKARRDQIAAKLDAKPIDLATSIEINNQLRQLNAEIRAYESEQHSSVCTKELKPTMLGLGPGFDVSAEVSFDGSRLILACVAGD